MPWGFAAAGLASVAGGFIAADAAGGAANTEAAAANRSTDVQRQMYDQTVAREQPYADAGGNALTALQRGIGIGPGTNGSGSGPLNRPFTAEDFHNSPGYQFQVQEGENSILNNASHLGGVNSGNTLKALTKFGQGTANQDYWTAYNAFVNRQNQQFGQLDTLAGSGQNASANLGAIGAQTGASVGNNIIGAGNASAAGQVAGASAINNGVQGLSQNFLLYSLLNGGSMPGGGGGGTAYGSSGWSSAFD